LQLNHESQWAAPHPSSLSKFLRIKDEQAFSEAVQVAWHQRLANLPSTKPNDRTIEENLDTFAQEFMIHD